MTKDIGTPQYPKNSSMDYVPFIISINTTSITIGRFNSNEPLGTVVSFKDCDLGEKCACRITLMKAILDQK